MQGLVTFCHAARKGGHLGSYRPTHWRSLPLLDGFGLFRECKMRKGNLGIGALLAFAIAGSAANAAVVYSENFELGLGDAHWSGAGSVQSTGGLGAFLGTYHLRNDGALGSILTLDGLASHTSLTLTFDLAMWDSIDYHDTNLDIFQISVDGTFLYNGPLGNYWGSPINTYGNSIGPGTPPDSRLHRLYVSRLWVRLVSRQCPARYLYVRSFRIVRRDQVSIPEFAGWIR